MVAQEIGVLSKPMFALPRRAEFHRRRRNFWSISNV